MFGAGTHNWLGSKSTALACLMVVTVWKEAGFFMIFYLAALQSMSPHLAEAAAIEGASRWHFFRRITFPLLMPTTLFVLVNAVINAFRLVDHVVVMTRGGPDNATSLLLYYVYAIGFRFWDTAYAAALTMVLLALLGARRWRSSGSSSGRFTTNDARLRAARGRSRARDRRGVAAGVPLAAAALVRGLDGLPPGGILDALRADRAAHARELPEGVDRRAVRALLPEHDGARRDGARRASSCW
jgi:ABC-type Fe3+ transport system permease subunit